MILTLLKQSKKNVDGKCFEDDINNMKNSHKGIKSIISLRIRHDSPKTINPGDHAVTNP